VQGGGHVPGESNQCSPSGSGSNPVNSQDGVHGRRYSQAASYAGAVISNAAEGKATPRPDEETAPEEPAIEWGSCCEGDGAEEMQPLAARLVAGGALTRAGPGGGSRVESVAREARGGAGGERGGGGRESPA
jgi:hypothetical protein